MLNSLLSSPGSATTPGRSHSLASASFDPNSSTVGIASPINLNQSMSSSSGISTRNHGFMWKGLMDSGVFDDYYPQRLNAAFHYLCLNIPGEGGSSSIEDGFLTYSGDNSVAISFSLKVWWC
jgi:hypothetical protein